MEILYLVLLILAGIFAVNFLIPVILVLGTLYILTRLIFRGSKSLGRRSYDSFNPFEANREDPEYRDEPQYGRGYTYYEESTEDNLGSMGEPSAPSEESFIGTEKPDENNPFEEVPMSVTDDDFFAKQHEVIDAEIEEDTAGTINNQ